MRSFALLLLFLPSFAQAQQRMLTSSVGLAADPVTTSDFPGPSQYFGLARVAAQPGESVRFEQLLEYHCAKTSCADSDLFVANGDRLETRRLAPGDSHERRWPVLHFAPADRPRKTMAYPTR